jgi:hypothetical protein
MKKVYILCYLGLMSGLALVCVPQASYAQNPCDKARVPNSLKV